MFVTRFTINIKPVYGRWIICVSPSQLNKIASNTNLNYKQVNIWFIKKRLNQKKSKKNNCLITGNNQFNVAITKDLLDENNKNKYADKQSVDRIALKVGLTSKQVLNCAQDKD